MNTSSSWLDNIVPTERVKIYGASKLKHAEVWRAIRDNWANQVELTSRWPFLHVGNIPDTEYYAKIFWQQDVEDVTAADTVVIYAEPDDKLRGALVEAGIAIALNKPVIVIGDHPDFGTWQYHPLVSRVPDLITCRTLLTCMGMKNV